ncbi:MAG: hypothetical protein B7Z12_16540 [Caulobacter vibrioides]|uniref:CENP-V/GFA domain-containing protein n=1 Tax=Caulobacter vibrioides TaxID=155892 RepID=A0A258CYS3_CAUVI|nr:MAG: hypothetical protein B7Z12_16540 [Caulobacter vibrioides]
MAQHQGGCQCGQVRFRVDVELEDSIQCNCSRCGKLGSVLAFADSASFTLEQGEDALTEFRFNTHRVAHLFCRACGIQSFGRGTAPNGQEVIAVNLRNGDCSGGSPRFWPAASRRHRLRDRDDKFRPDGQSTLTGLQALIP